jgi:chromate transporter
MKENIEKNFAFPLAALIQYFLRLGLIGFGGPVALLGYMQKDLIDQRKWFTQKQYNDGLALAQLCPGPIATQLCMYLGWIRSGWWGALCTGVALALPAYFVVLLLSWFYIEYGQMPPLRKIFAGMSAAVLAVIIMAAWRLFKKSVWHERDLTAVALISFFLTIWAGSELFWVFVFSGAAIALVRNKKLKNQVLQGISLFTFPGYIGQDFDVLKKMTWYFFEVGAMVFGSGMVIVPFLYHGVVGEYGWLNEAQFQDALAVAMVTPGPAVITVAFMGFLISGLPGSILAPIGIFAPCYLFTIMVAPIFSKIIQNNKPTSAFVDGVSAAAVGAIGGAVWIIGKKMSWTPLQAVIFALAAVLLLRFKIPDALVILAAGVAGLFLTMP